MNLMKSLFPVVAFCLYVNEEAEREKQVERHSDRKRDRITDRVDAVLCFLIIIMFNHGLFLGLNLTLINSL